MGVYKKAIITEQGEAALAQAMAGNKVIQFSHARISDYTYPAGTDFRKLTELQDIKQEVIPSNVQIMNESTISVRTLFENKTVLQEYQIQNIGLYIMIGDMEILFSISQAETPDLMPVYNGIAPSSFLYNIFLAVSQADEISVNVNPAGTATIQDIIELQESIDDLNHNKVSSDNGNISNTVSRIEIPATAERYPVLEEGKVSGLFGKVQKWLDSLKTDKIDIMNGDIANTKVSKFEAAAASFPVPAAGESPKVLWGKMKRFTEDFKNWYTGVCTIGSIVNNCTSSAANQPLSAAQGKVLMDLYTQLNGDFGNKLKSYADTNSFGCIEILGVKFIYGAIVQNIAMTTAYPGGLYWGRATIAIPSNFKIINFYCIQLMPYGGGLTSLSIDSVTKDNINVFAYNTDSKTANVAIQILALAY